MQEPTGHLRELERAAWAKAARGDRSAIVEFLRAFPDGEFFQTAQRRLNGADLVFPAPLTKMTLALRGLLAVKPLKNDAVKKASKKYPATKPCG